jgi:transcriptional regulator with XRE-family HTH domain
MARESPEQNNLTPRHHVLRADADLQTRLGAVVRACRHRLGVTQEELAWRAGIHRTYLADIERGKRNVTLRTAANLSRTLQITIGHLFAHAAEPSATAPRLDSGLVPNEVRDILLVEHHPRAAAETARAFERARLANPIKIVGDGETGLNFLFGTGRYARRKQVRPQLILLVLDLPGMSGAEFLRRVGADERTRDILVLVLTVSKQRRL